MSPGDRKEDSRREDGAEFVSDSFDSFLKDVARVSDARPGSEAVPLRPGTKLEGDRIQILRRLGEGGMGVVHAALDRSIGREVALKELAARQAADGRSQQEFINEARITGQLQHPGVVPVYALAKGPNGAPYFTMQVVDGCTLTQWLSSAERKPATRQRLEGGIEILLRVCDALSFAHSRRILHRDVKPQNIMVGPHGRVYLMDWGLAISLDDGAREHGVAGTLPYMAPEQARGAGIDERADVFGVGAVLYEIVSGRTPYGDSDGDLAQRVAGGQVVPLSDAMRRMPASPRLCQIVDRAVSSDRELRHASVAELQAELSRFLRRGLHLPRRSVAEGEVIIREGDPGESAYLIIEGSCQVRQRTAGREIALRTMGPGEVFGEMAVLLDEVRTATVIANEPTTLIVIDRQALQATGVLEGWSSALLAALANRFRTLERQVRER